MKQKKKVIEEEIIRKATLFLGEERLTRKKSSAPHKLWGLSVNKGSAPGTSLEEESRNTAGCDRGG